MIFPPSSAPYQSKLLRTIMRQTQRWTDRGNRLWRQVRVAATWTAQILLYPIYAVVQTSRLLGTRLYQRIQLQDLADRDAVDAPETLMGATIAPEPAMMQVDTPIRRVLATLQTLALSDPLPILLDPPDVNWRSSHVALLGLTSQPGLTVRGLASCLTSRSIVLVTPQNCILDILTPTQQAQLRDRWVWDLADYGYQCSVPAAPAPLPGSSLLSRVDRLWQQGRQWLQQWSSGFEVRRSAALPDRPQICHPHYVLHQALQTVGQMVIAPDRLAALTLDSQLALSPTSQPVYIRGIASLIAPRPSAMPHPQRLVLVTSENVLLDILTPAQHDRLQQRLAWEISHYRRYWELRRLTARVFEPIAPAPESQPVFPIVRRLQQLMAWVQTSPVAIATNLFQEAQHPFIWEAALPVSQPDPMALMETPTAEGEGQATVPRQLPGSAWADLGHYLRQPMAYFSKMLITDTSVVSSPSDLSVTIDGSVAMDGSVAIDGSAAEAVRAIGQTPQNLLPAASTAMPDGLAALAHKTQLLWQTISQRLCWAAPIAGPPGLSRPLETVSSGTIAPRPIVPEPQIYPSSPIGVTPAATSSPTQSTFPVYGSHLDYIDIQATVIGYLQSPVERMLRWLDRGLLSIEAMIAASQPRVEQGLRGADRQWQELVAAMDQIQPVMAQLLSWLDRSLLWLANALGAIAQFLGRGWQQIRQAYAQWRSPSGHPKDQ